MPFSEIPNAASIQRRLWKGYAKVACKQGLLSGIYRPDNAQSPFANKVGNIFVVYTNSYGFAKPDRFGVSTMFGVFDGSLVRQGDYLVTPPFDDTRTDPLRSFSNTGDPQFHDVFYIASIDLNAPCLLVETHRTISVSRVIQSTSKGFIGNISAVNETVLLSGWRASILQGTKGEKNATELPMDVRLPWWTITLPSYAGVVIKEGDIIRDDLGRKYLVSSPELTQLGWRITASLERV